MNKYQIIFICLFFGPVTTKAQEMWPGLPSGKDLNPSDITRPYSNIAFAGEFIDMVEGNLWQWDLQGGIALGQNKHGFSFEVPFVRSIYPGIEQLTGIGDISLRYHVMTYESKTRVRTLASSALYFDLSIPTGDSYQGHGTGVPVFTPGFVLAYRPVPQIAIYPKISYHHSFGTLDIDSGGGYPGTIPANPASGEMKIRVFDVEGMFNYEFNQAWIGIAPAYTYSFFSKEGTLNIRPQIGKLFADKISINLSGSFYVAGRRRLISWTYFDARYFF